MSYSQNALYSQLAQQAVRSLLESPEEPVILVVVLNASEEDVREMRFEPITNCAALLKLHNLNQSE